MRLITEPTIYIEITGGEFAAFSAANPGLEAIPHAWDDLLEYGRKIEAARSPYEQALERQAFALAKEAHALGASGGADLTLFGIETRITRCMTENRMIEAKEAVPA